MKKITLTLISIFALAAVAFAQDLAEATETFNNGATALAAGEKESALTFFEQALEMAAIIGEDGTEISDKCKSTIPSLILSIAKDKIKESAFDDAISFINKAGEKAKEYSDAESEVKATELLGTALLAKGKSLLSDKDFAGAAEACEKAFQIDTTDGLAALYLGMASDKLGKVEAAEEAYLKAAALGQDKNAKKQLVSMFTKLGATALGKADYTNALELCKKALQFGENASACKVAGTAAMKLGDKSVAVEYLEQYLKLSPAAKDAAQIAQAIEALKK